jgi:hypothetical protein
MTRDQTHKLMRDMIEMSAEYGKVPTVNCVRVSAILQTAANIINDLLWKEQKYEEVLNRIVAYDKPSFLASGLLADWMQQLAKEVLLEEYGTQSYWQARYQKGNPTVKESLSVTPTTEESSAVQLKKVLQ